MSWTETVERYLAEGRTVSGGKGDSSASSTEKSTAAFTSQLQAAFAANNTRQQAQLDFLNGKLQDAINNPQGYSPEALAAQRTQAEEQAATENKNVMQAVNNKFAGQTGATSLPSGVQEQIAAAVNQQSAENEGRAQLGITQADAELANQNKWRAIQGEEGVAGEENPTAFASNANNAAGEVGNLSQAVTAANGPGLGSILGGIGGSVLGDWATGGFKV